MSLSSQEIAIFLAGQYLPENRLSALEGDLANKQSELRRKLRAIANSAKRRPSLVSKDYLFRAVRSVNSGNPILGAVQDCMRREQERASEHVLQKLRNWLTRTANFTLSSCATLFILDGDAICPLITYNVTRAFPRLHRGSKGIVPLVIRENLTYVTNDVATDPYYREDNPDTRSEIAMPVTVNGRLVGCVNVEARSKGAFGPREIEVLGEAVGQIAPELSIYLGLNRDSRCPWHPDLHGWDLERVCEQICFAITDSVNPTRTHAAIWYNDSFKEELFIYATTGYGADFRYDRTLPLNSPNGQVAFAPPGTVVEIDPRDFVYPDRATALGVTTVLATPVHSFRHQRNIAALHVYLNSAELAQAVLREALPVIATWIGILADQFEDRRRDYCVTRLQYLRQVLPSDCDSDFDAERDFFQMVFSAPGVTLTGLLVGSHTLRVVSTTGLVRTDGWRCAAELQSRRRAEADDVSYDLETGTGMTVYMGRHPDLCVRKNSVLNPGEPMMPADFPKQGNFEYVEDFRPQFRDQRRLLSASVGIADEKYSIGVVRCVRPGKSKPFTACDERLMTALVKVCIPSFLAWRRLSPPTAVPPVPAITSSPSDSSEKPQLTLLRPIPVTRSTEALIGDTLRWLFSFYRTRCSVLWTSLLLRHRFDVANRYQIKGFFSDQHRSPPEKGKAGARIDDVIEWNDILNAGDPIAFTSDSAQKSGACASGVRVPLIAWLGPNPVRGILTIDFSDRVQFTVDDLEIIHNAAWRLATIFNTTGPLASSSTVINPRFTEMDTAQLVFQSFPAEVANLFRLDRCDLFLQEASSFQPQPPPPWLRKIEDWPPADEERTRWNDLAVFGVTGNPDHKGISVPLWINAKRVGELCCIGNKLDSPAEVQRLVQAVTCLWSSITFGHSPYSRVEISPHEETVRNKLVIAPNTTMSILRWPVVHSGLRSLGPVGVYDKVPPPLLLHFSGEAANALRAASS